MGFGVAGFRVAAGLDVGPGSIAFALSARFALPPPPPPTGFAVVLVRGRGFFATAALGFDGGDFLARPHHIARRIRRARPGDRVA
ncbi:MAG: hypothetical protein WKG01_39690, partial [Kofleriaceae bacterium]